MTFIIDATPDEFRFYLRRRRLRFRKALGRAAGSVIFFDRFGAGLHLARKLHGGHEEIEKRDQGTGAPGKAGLKDGPPKTVVADGLTDNGAVFLFNEAAVVFFVGSRAGKRDGASGGAVPVGTDMIDKFAAVITVELPEREGKARMDGFEGVERPAMSLV